MESKVISETLLKSLWSFVTSSVFKREDKLSILREKSLKAFKPSNNHFKFITLWGQFT